MCFLCLTHYPLDMFKKHTSFIQHDPLDMFKKHNSFIQHDLLDMLYMLYSA